MRRKRTKRNYFEPQRHPDHKRPVTRREFIGQGFLTGAASVAGLAGPSLCECCAKERGRFTRWLYGHIFIESSCEFNWPRIVHQAKNGAPETAVQIVHIRNCKPAGRAYRNLALKS